MFQSGEEVESVEEYTIGYLYGYSAGLYEDEEYGSDFDEGFDSGYEDGYDAAVSGEDLNTSVPGRRSKRT